MRRSSPLTASDLIVCRKMREELGKLRKLKSGMQTYEENISSNCYKSACVQEDEGGDGETEVRNADL